MVTKELKNLLSFLTIFPVKMDKDMLTDCAKSMWAFPLIGAFIGLLAGVFGWIAYQFLPGIVVGGLVLALLLLITGLHHMDGLLDFGDGVMAHGTAEHKIEVMHDQLTGAGGLSLGIMTMLISALAIGQFKIGLIVGGLIVAEASAKLAMVVTAWAGKSAHQGMNSPFVEAMHGAKGNLLLIVALVISFAIAVPLLRVAGVAVVLAGILTGLVMVAIAQRNFNGVTGDVFGATNEITRMVCLIVLLAVAAWA
ncbi:MAG TPA: adenosylcobinamide-GDP ribazoletransferase [Candidatus Limnocylindrales bacterium]|nr:adenosylcobinamide-GDP ribazoletransferase [Candidatus Limnocylindrales bacterium]